MKMMKWIVLMVWLVNSHCALSAADITSIGVSRGPGDRGIWGTGYMAWIGVTSFGSEMGAFLNGANGSVKLPSGCYYLYFSYENYWTGSVPADFVTVAVSYSDGSGKSAVFDQGAVLADTNWNRISGDSSLLLGSTGVTSVDFMSGTAFEPNGVNDIILKFSDTGAFPAPVAPVFQNVSQANGIITLAWSSEVNGIYQLQSCNRLVQSNWANLGNQLTATGIVTTATNSIGTNACQFYRAIRVK